MALMGADLRFRGKWLVRFERLDLEMLEGLIEHDATNRRTRLVAWIAQQEEQMLEHPQQMSRVLDLLQHRCSQLLRSAIAQLGSLRERDTKRVRICRDAAHTFQTEFDDLVDAEEEL